MDVSKLGEFGLIERLRKSLPAASERLVVGPGDDAAVWRSGDGYTIATTDTMVAGVHFLPALVRWRDVGWKALAVNISDIAAMGGAPSFALVTLMLPPETSVENIDELYAGLRECAEEYGVEIAGGDVVAAPVFAITVALTGEASVAADGSPRLLRRDTAEPGDVVAVTGMLGGSAGGLLVLREGSHSAALASRLVKKHMRPQPRLHVGQAALASGIRCSIDISDGLIQDLSHVCKASRVSSVVRLFDVPIDDGLLDLGTYHLLSFGPNELRTIAATGGEDYELILVGPRPKIRALVHSSTTVTIIGEIIERSSPSSTGHRRRVRCLDEQGDEVRLTKTGWKHF